MKGGCKERCREGITIEGTSGRVGVEGEGTQREDEGVMFKGTERGVIEREEGGREKNVNDRLGKDYPLTHTNHVGKCLQLLGETKPRKTVHQQIMSLDRVTQESK